MALTADADDLTGTANDDTFSAGLTASGVQTLQTFDRIDGGEGTDTLKATLLGTSGQNDTIALEGVVSNIENYYFRAIDTGFTETVNLANVAAPQQVWADRILGDLAVTGVAALTTLGAVRGEENTFSVSYVDGAVDAALNNDNEVSQSVVLNNADVTLQVDEATSAFADATGGATLNAALTGDNTVVLTGDITDVIDTIATTGEGSIDLDVSARATAVDWDITLGAGDDRLVIDGTNLDANDSIDMGAGDDVLALAGLTAAGDLDTLDLSGVSNVEGLEFTGNAVVTNADTDTLSLESLDNVTFGGTLDSVTGAGTLVLDTDAAALETTFEGNVGAAIGVSLTVSEEVESLNLNAESSDVVLNGLTNAAAAADNSTESLTSLTLADTSVEDPATGVMTASTYDVTLADVNGLTSLNLEGIAGTDSADNDYASSITVDASTADFAGPVTVSIAEGTYTYYNDSNDKREIFQFSGDDIGTVVIGGVAGDVAHTGDVAFAITSAGNGDKLDFGQFANVSSLDDLAITGGNGTDYTISAAADQFEGSISLVGTGNIEQSVLEANGFIF